MDAIELDQAEELLFFAPMTSNAAKAMEQFHQAEKHSYREKYELLEPDPHHIPELHTPTIANGKEIEAYIYKGDSCRGFYEKPPIWLYLNDYIFTRFDISINSKFDHDEQDEILTYIIEKTILSTTTLNIAADFTPIKVKYINSVTIQTIDTKNTHIELCCNNSTIPSLILFTLKISAPNQFLETNHENIILPVQPIKDAQ